MEKKLSGKTRSRLRKTPNRQSDRSNTWKLVNCRALGGPQITGRIAENLVIWYLKCRGWTIRARNYATRYGEIDIIAMRWDADLKGYPTVAFVEVKARTNLQGLLPEQSVSRAKRRRINQTIKKWIGDHPREKAVYRRDIASVWLVPHQLPSIHYIPSAFTNDDVYGW